MVCSLLVWLGGTAECAGRGLEKQVGAGIVGRIPNLITLIVSP